MIKITQTEPNKLTINGKEAIKLNTGKWQISDELTPEESQAFVQHTKAMKAVKNIKEIKNYWNEQSGYVER